MTVLTKVEANSIDFETIYSYIAPGVHPQFRLEVFAAKVIDEDGLWWIDPLDARIKALLALPREASITYNGQPLTTISQRIYGNISCWWILLLCSGYLHPHEIPLRQSFAAPSVARLAQLIRPAERNNVAKKIVF